MDWNSKGVYFIPLYGFFFRFIIYVFLTYLVVNQLARCSDVTLTDCRIPRPHISLPGFGSAVLLIVIFSGMPIWGHAGYWSFNTENIMQLKTGFFESFFYSGFCSGIVEEMMFRGYITKISENQWGSVKGIILPTLLFSLGHCLTLGQLTGGQILLFISLSILLTVITYQSNSVWDSALVHAEKSKIVLKMKCFGYCPIYGKKWQNAFTMHIMYQAAAMQPRSKRICDWNVSGTGRKRGINGTGNELYQTGTGCGSSGTVLFWICHEKE